MGDFSHNICHFKSQKYHLLGFIYKVKIYQLILNQIMKEILKVTLAFCMIARTICRDCYLSCDQVQITYDKQSCYNNCDQKYIAGFTVGGFFALLIIICVICYCKYRSFTCACLVRRRLLNKYNKLSIGSYSKQSFEAQKNKIISALKKSDSLNNFFFKKEKVSFLVNADRETISIFEEGDFLTRIEFAGMDKVGKFTAEGYFLCRDQHFYFWFYSQYQFADNAVQQGLKSILIFQSEKINENACSGSWYCESDTDVADIQGQWALVMKVVGADNRLQQIRSHNYLI